MLMLRCENHEYSGLNTPVIWYGVSGSHRLAHKLTVLQHPYRIQLTALAAIHGNSSPDIPTSPRCLVIPPFDPAALQH